MSEENKNTEEQPAENKEQFMDDGSSFMEIPAFSRYFHER